MLTSEFPKKKIEREKQIYIELNAFSIFSPQVYNHLE